MVTLHPSLFLLPAAVMLVAHACAPGDQTPKNPGDGDGKDGKQPPEVPRPSWWPDKAQFPDGWDWPPPPPPGWNGQDPFPPPGVDLEDPKWWIDRYGVDFDPTQPGPGGGVEPNANGSDGTVEFANSFRQVLECDAAFVPGCGLFVIEQWAEVFTCRDGGCTPYPAADLNRMCRDALDEQTAAQTCRAMCLRNRQQCRRHRLFTPALHATWSCDAGVQCPGGLHCGSGGGCEETQHSCPNNLVTMECRAHFLCSCWDE